MKKICSLALVLCMLLALVAVPTAAETAPEHITFKDTDTTYTDSEGVVYNIIRTKEAFLAIENGKNYILADNINLDMTVSGEGASAFGTSTYSWHEGIMDGNGYAIYGYKIDGNLASNTGACGLFYWGKGASALTTVNVIFKNLSFGTEESPFVYIAANNGGFGAITGKIGGTDAVASSVRVINCKSYVDCDDVDTSAMTKRKANKGGFIGYTINKNVSFYFENCATYGTINANNKNGGYIGCINQAGCSVTFVNCANNINLNCNIQGAAGFIGQVNNNGAVLLLKNCVNNGNITGTDRDVGGMIGYCLTPNLTMINCKNNGTVKTADGVTCGTMIGRTNTSTAVSIVVPVSEVDSLAGALGCKNNEDQPDPKVTLMANGNGTASAGWQKTTADDNGNVKVRLLVAVSDEYLEEIQTMTFTGTFGLTAGGSKTLTMTLGGDKPVKYYSSVVAAGETLVAAEGYVLIPVVVENIPEADWDGTVSMKLTATGSDNVVAYYQYN